MIKLSVKLMQVIFISAKLSDYVDWNWWVVFAPSITYFTVVGIMTTTVFFLLRVSESFRKGFSGRLEELLKDTQKD